MTTELVRFDAAKKALVAARSVDEVKKIRDVAMATRLYAQQAKDKTLIADATEIRLRAERRLGEMIKVQPKSKGGGTGGNRYKPRTGVSKTPAVTITLAEVGIDKNLAKRARAAAVPTEKQFDKKVEAAREAAVSAVDTAMRVINKVESRKEREEVLAKKILAMPTVLAGLLYADPPWRLEMWSEKGSDRAAENQYPTMTDDEIIALGSLLPVADDCTLFLWATAPKLRSALDVMKYWGFEYKSFLAWDKQVKGTGHIVRSQVELLLIGTRGKAVPPAALDGLISVKRGAHSTKPAVFAEIIEEQYPNVPKLELFARGKGRPGWLPPYGNEAEE